MTVQVKVSKGARFAGGDDSVCAAYDGKTEGVELVYQLKISNPDINVSAVRPSILFSGCLAWTNAVGKRTELEACDLLSGRHSQKVVV